ncbi:unnamed protein product [Coffea canephora]|uniref:PDZ domain-containing protein n=1 Tax=Coffea canephora TaxID=49390 RepID=A0A068UVH6_COFCA|nr:unnamed protein product [Coffea canephora]
MSSSVVAGASSSCSAAYVRNLSLKSNSSIPSANAKRLTSHSEKFSFQGRQTTGPSFGSKVGWWCGHHGVEGGGNAAKAGLKVGDQVLHTSSFFRDELWPADKLGFTETAIQAKSDSVYFVVSKQALLLGAGVDVKLLQKRPAPPQFGRKLTDAPKARLNI